jgi:hypothetical protein
VRVPRGFVGRLARDDVRRLKEKDHFTDFFQEDARAGSAGANVVTDAAGLNWASSSASIGRFCVEIAVLRS